MILLKIDDSKLDRSRLFHGKNGAKYLDLVLVENKNGPDQYGNDGFATQSRTKEESAANVRMPILGNWKRLGNRPQAPAERTPPAPRQTPKNAPDDGCPF